MRYKFKVGLSCRASTTAALCALALMVPRAQGSALYDWHTLESVHKVAVVPPFFCDVHPAPRFRGDEYPRDLRVLTLCVSSALPASLAETGRFQVVPQRLIMKTLRRAHWSVQDLYARSARLLPETEGKLGEQLDRLNAVLGRRRNRDSEHWPAPELARVVGLARRLHVDAVLLGAMREPASIGDGYQFYHDKWNLNPLNWGLKRIRTHVISPRIRLYLITSRGAVAWRGEEMADRPRTRPRTAHTLLLDWEDATAEAVQQLTDSLTRLPPPGSPKGPGA